MVKKSCHFGSYKLYQLSQVKFDLPVFVYAGLIGSLELQVPWKNLWTAPTRVCVEDLVLLVVPKEAAPYKLVRYQI